MRLMNRAGRAGIFASGDLLWYRPRSEVRSGSTLDRAAFREETAGHRPVPREDVTRAGLMLGECKEAAINALSGSAKTRNRE